MIIAGALQHLVAALTIRDARRSVSRKEKLLLVLTLCIIFFHKTAVIISKYLKYVFVVDIKAEKMRTKYKLSLLLFILQCTCAKC